MKLKVKDFKGVQVKIDKKKNGDLFIDVTPIIDRANKIISSEYVVFYTKGCSSKTKTFKTEKAARKFAEKHEKLNTDLYSDDWVDCIVEGKVINWINSYLKE